jgi:hypothetical protein
MSAKIHWLDERHTIILNIYEGKWHWEDAIYCLQQSEILLNEVQHKVAILADFSATTGAPTLNMTLMRDLGSHPLIDHPNFSAFYVVGIRMQVSIMLEVFSRIMPRVFSRFHMMPSLEVAISTINAKTS